MAVTLQQLYDGVKDKEEIKLVAGEKGLYREVQWVHMVEGTIISDFLQGNEISFTTGVALNSQEDLYELVEFNYKKNVSGMVINVGPFIQEISQEIKDFGDKHDFPIFEVPWRVHMANIMHYFAAQINLDEQRSLECGYALKNAVYFPKSEALYLPTFLKYGYKREWSFCVAIIKFYDNMYHILSEKQRNKLQERLERHLLEKNPKMMIQDMEGEIILMFPNCKEKKVQEMLNHAWEDMKPYTPNQIHFYAGIGRSTKSIRCIGKCYHQARQVLEIQKKKHIKNYFASYNELGIAKLLLAIENEEIIEEYYQEVLGKLEKYDHVNETDYYYFLKQYFELNCSSQAVSAKLHFHRNSVTYKLHKCEEILGLSISEQENRTKLMIAFMLKEIKRKK